MGQLRFEADASVDVDPVLEAWRHVGGRTPDSVERLVDVRGNKRRVYARAGIYRLRGAGASGSGVVAKCSTAATLSTEALLYGDVLPGLSLPSPKCYGYVEGGPQSWLFMEEIVGQPFAPRSITHQELAARWLARLHSGTSRTTLASRLPQTGPRQYFDAIGTTRTLLLNARRVLRSEARRSLSVLIQTLATIETIANDTCERCANLPQCVVHADFVDKNVLVTRRRGDLALFALDWGISGWGVPAPDLEYLDTHRYFGMVSHAWPHVQRSDIQFLKAVGIVMRQLGIVGAWATCLSETPEWTMERIAEPAEVLSAGAAELMSHFR